VTVEQTRSLPGGTGPIPAGRYETATFRPRLSLAVDGTWRSLKGEYADVFDLVQAPAPATNLLTFVRVDRVFEAMGAPATQNEIDAAVTPAPVDVAAWIQSHPRLETTAEPVELGGHRGVRIAVAVAPGRGYPGARCPSRCVLLFPLAAPGRLFELVEGNSNRLDVLVVDGVTVVVATEAPSAEFAAFGKAVDRVLPTVMF
jgi:hypothetical protein